ncbi:MAG: TadE/TadG family type IV pilus assembly protein [Pseudomonadota bacterium]
MSTRRLNKQAGVIVTLFVIALPVMLGLWALAIDCGGLYLTRLRLTKVARASSATALNMMAIRGWGALVANPETGTPSLDLGLKTANLQINDSGPITVANQAVLQEIRQSARDGLAAYYPGDFNSTNNHLALSYFKFKDLAGNLHDQAPLSFIDRNNSLVAITLRYAAKTYLLGAISQILGGSGPCVQIDSNPGLRCWVENVPTPNNATGVMKSANVFMLLDVSGSMGEYSGGRPKSARLVEAAARFIDMFNPTHDKFAVIPYATSADVGPAPTLRTLERTTVNGSPDYLKIKTDISKYVIGGQTNQCDALIQVIRTIEANPTLKDTVVPKFVLLFTDGAPNVYRTEFCHDGSCNSTPPRLNQARSGIPISIDSDHPGWYGWTVKWGKREVFHRTDPNQTCPTGDPGGGEVADNSSSIPVCDPVWNFPKVISGTDGQELTYTDVSRHLRLDENGDFVFKGSPYRGETLSQLGYSLKFIYPPVSGPRDYQLSDAYRWHGPSYLVHSSFLLPRGASLMERIPKEMEDNPLPYSVTPAITCGPGSRNEFPGHRTQVYPNITEKYHHSRYFASRAIDADWRWNGTFSDDSQGKAAKTGLTTGQLNQAPSYFDVPYTLLGYPHDTPGCLTSPHARIPFTSAQIVMGDKFVANDPNTTAQRGEVVKTEELPYYCALRAADWLRSKYNVVIFVVGLGQSATDIYGADCRDPLQNALDPNSRKDNFLRRLAFSPESLTDPAQFFAGNTSISWRHVSDFRYRNDTLSYCSNHPMAGVNVDIGYSEESLLQTNGYTPTDHGFTTAHLGAYYGSDNPDDLNLIFGEIAKRMLLRLAS